MDIHVLESSSNFIQTHSIIAEMDFRSVNYELNYISKGNTKTEENNFKNIVTTAIDEGRPVIVSGGQHACVAYAYDSQYVYVHDGRVDPLKKVSWELYSKDAEHKFGVFDIRLTGEHVHSNNYICKYGNQVICPNEQIYLKNSGDYYVYNRSNTACTYKVKFVATSNPYVSISTIAGSIDTSFYNITCSSGNISYEYADDTEG